LTVREQWSETVVVDPGATTTSSRGPVTYAEAAAEVGRIPNGRAAMLDRLEHDCAKRGEPNLAVFVVNKATGAPAKYASRAQDWHDEQSRCSSHVWETDDLDGVT
jgi:hypothetical protein